MPSTMHLLGHVFCGMLALMLPTSTVSCALYVFGGLNLEPGGVALTLRSASSLALSASRRCNRSLFFLVSSQLGRFIGVLSSSDLCVSGIAASSTIAVCVAGM